MTRISDPARRLAPGAAVVSVQVPQAEIALYEIRKKIYPRAVQGVYARWRWTLVIATQLLFYGLPWLSWNGRQAVLFDLGARKFFIFGLVFWPQDVIYLAVLLILSALSLFLFTAVAGRLWCGYACPQTVYTEMFLWVERRIEGDRPARMRLDAAPVSPRKVLRKSAKHLAWLAIALWTGYTFVGYFTPVAELGPRTLAFDVGPWEAFWILFYGFATYGNAGFMREQVCKYMCPYARFQSVMFDRDTLVITYDAARGDPRGARSRKAHAAASGLGDCVDCSICVQVCPTGIDIRNGLQYDCIGCAACVDGCNQVMDRMGYARGLIRYTTENALARGLDARAIWKRVLRPRTTIYLGSILLIAVAASVSLYLKNPLKVDVIRDRGVLAREVEAGVIENVYRLQIMNTDERAREFVIEAAGLSGLQVVGVAQPVAVQAAATRLVPLRLRASEPARVAASGDDAHEGHADTRRIEITVRASDDTHVARVERSSFVFPR
ncbi:MAG TPA: cytochrome c oxidase accessory protein CcoG [Casimicrobiaceae bacterium]|nr:cytochrome c oxidase accessory protein CcoG [Casimicrobiaceae bacterium]